LVFDEDEDASEHVFEDGLRAKGDAEADDTCRCNERSERDSDGFEDLGEEIEADNSVGRGAEDRSHCAELRSALGVADECVGAFAHAADEESHDALEDEREKQGEEKLWESVLDEVGEVGAPAVEDGTEEVLVVRERV